MSCFPHRTKELRVNQRALSRQLSTKSLLRISRDHHLTPYQRTKAIILHFLRSLTVRAKQSGWVEENIAEEGQAWPAQSTCDKLRKWFTRFQDLPDVCCWPCSPKWLWFSCQSKQLGSADTKQEKCCKIKIYWRWERELTRFSMAQRYLAQSWCPLYSAKSAAVNPSISWSEGFAWLANRILQHWEKE